MNTFEVGYAKSGRFMCKKCQDSINEGTVLMGVTNYYGGQHQVSWYHLDCLRKLSVSRSCTSQNTAGFDALRRVDQDDLVRKFELTYEEDEHVKRPRTTQFPAYNGMDSATVSEEAASESKPELPSVSLQRLRDRLIAIGKARRGPAYRYKKLCETLDTKSIEELKEMCRKNDEELYGSKEDLIKRVAAGKVGGRIPKCMACNKYALNFNPTTKLYVCSGDPRHPDHLQCGKTFRSSEIDRIPWID